MREVLTRLRQTLLLQREAFVWMDFNDRATGDAFVLVGLTGLLKFVGFFGGLGSLFVLSAWDTLIEFMISALIQWLLFSGISWAIVRYFVQAEATFATYLRFTGFAYPTTLIALAVALVTRELGLLPFVAGFVWFFFIVARGIEYASDLDKQRSMLVAGGSLVGLVLVNALLGSSPIF